MVVFALSPRIQSFLIAIPPTAHKRSPTLRLWSSTVSPSKNNQKKKIIFPSPTTSNTTLFPTVLLRRNSQSKSFRNGNQLVFTKALLHNHHHLTLGDVVQVAVADPSRGPPVSIGWGVYNPSSLYRVRILVHKFLHPTLYRQMQELSSHETNEMEDTNEMAVACIARHHLSAAWTLRHTALGLSTESIPTTDTFRWINGEGDHMSGFSVDIVGGTTAVCMSSAAWCQRYRRVLETAVLERVDRVVWKTTSSRLKQDGYRISKNPSVDSTMDRMEDNQMVVATENGIQYETHPFQEGQKTSVYCDQRENRLRLATYCQGKTVLDLCCYEGGFSLNAAKHGGATKCVGVDSSAAAIATARKNAHRNGVADVCSFVKADIAEYLQGTTKQHPPLQRPQFDVVILDPPKLAPAMQMLEKAGPKYRSLNRDAITAVDNEKGGILLTCTCSAAMTQQDGGRYFLRLVQSAAQSAGKHITLLSVQGAASCHTESPIAFPAGSYLTAAYFYVHPKSSG